MSFGDALNPTYLFNLTQNQMSKATSLVFSPYSYTSATSIDVWDNSAYYGSSADYALLNDTFKLHLTKGASYDFFSSSYFDPFILMIYNDNGVPVVANSEDNDHSYGFDIIWDYVAPYTGDYYVSASWYQGYASTHKYVSLDVYEDVDTIPKITATSNHAPTSFNTTISTNESTTKTLGLNNFPFTDVDVGNSLSKVMITTIPTAGSLKLNGVAVSLNQEITASDIGLGKLAFTPATNASGNSSASFGFKVSDGAAYSVTANTVTIDVLVSSQPITSTAVAETTRAKIFLGTNDIFTVGNSGTTVYSSGDPSDAVKLSQGINSVTLDQNADRVIMAQASTSYAFSQGGNTIKIHDATSNTLLATLPVQSDTDGTLISFANGTASAKLISGVMTLGGAILSSSATVANPFSNGIASMSTTEISGNTKAKVFLGVNDAFTVANSGATIYSSSGSSDAVTISQDVNSVTLDQNTDRIILNQPLNAYTYSQGGNTIKIYDATSTTLLATLPVQSDTNGTQLTFTNGTANAMLTSGVMTLGGATVSPIAATAVTPTTIDAAVTSISSMPTNTIAVSATGSTIDSTAINTTYEIASGTYTYSIVGFSAGDRIDFLPTATPNVTNSSFADGSVDLIWAFTGNVVTIRLTGLASDISLNSIADFNTVFGTGTIF